MRNKIICFSRSDIELLFTGSRTNFRSTFIGRKNPTRHDRGANRIHHYSREQTLTAKCAWYHVSDVNLPLSQTSPGFYVSAVKVF